MYSYPSGTRDRHCQCQRRQLTTVGRYDGWSFCVLQDTEERSVTKEVVLSVENLVVKRKPWLRSSQKLKLRSTLGIAGIDGNGQSELLQAITGLRKVESGKVLLNGDDITNFKPRKVTEAGVGHVPEDRHKYGLVLDMMLSENIALQTYYKNL